MRKHFIRSMFALLMVFGLTTAMVGAQEPAQSNALNNWFTSVTFQNVGTGTANVNIEAYGATGGPVTPDSPVSIEAGANQVFLPGLTDRAGFINMTLPADFQGGMVATADQPIVAISQIGNNQVGSNGVEGGAAIGQYRGSDSTDSTIFYPVVKNGLGNKITVFSIQAAEGNVDYTATITSQADGTTHTLNGSIEENRAEILLPASFDPPFPDDGLGSLTVEVTGGTGQLVGSVVETRSDAAIQNVGQAATMFTSAAGASTVFCPVVKFESGANQNTSGVTVQNLGPGEATVTMDTILTGGGTGTTSATIPEGGSRTFFGSGGDGIEAVGFESGNFGAATITADGGQSLVASVNESNVTVASLDAQKQTIYTCFNAATSTNTVAFPLVKERFGAPEAATSINLQNVGSSAVDVSVQYVCDTGSTTIPVNIAPNSGSTLFLTSGTPVNGQGVAANSNCAVTASAASGSQIIGFSQDTSDLGFAGGADSILDIRNYEGFNQ